MSAESGISTFRDSDGLWEQYNVEDVCTPEALQKNPDLVLDFYNQRRRQLLRSAPNKGHYDLVKLEKHFDVQIITQNVDNLHEKAGSSKVLHLHGELMKARSMGDENLIYDLSPENYEIKLGDVCKKGHQLRPHIVFFGEAVPMINTAAELCSKAELMVIIGTSMNVYPAAGLVGYTPQHCPIYFIDPQPNIVENSYPNLHIIPEKAGTGVAQLIKSLHKKGLISDNL